jgi:hypothetical protein
MERAYRSLVAESLAPRRAGGILAIAAAVAAEGGRMNRREILALAFVGGIWMLAAGVGVAQNATPTAGGQTVQVTLDVQGMH